MSLMLCCYLVCSWNYTQVSVHTHLSFQVDRFTKCRLRWCRNEQMTLKHGEEVEWWSSSLRVARTASIWSRFGKMPVTSGQNRARSGKVLWESMKMIAEILWGRWIFKRKIEKIQAEFGNIHGQWSGMVTWFGNQLDANGLEDSVRWEQKECYGENWAEGKDHDECMKEGIHSFPTVRFFSNLACRCM